MISPEEFKPGLMMALPWQQNAWQKIAAQQRTGRLAHAYLLQAAPGSGRRQFAQALASWLLCERSEEHDTACGQCRQCLLQASGPHPDLLFVTPEGDSKAIRIDVIRQMGEFIQQTAHQSDAMKIVVICPAEAMGIAAANSLLKNLEEPPGRSLFLLLADAGGHLLPTLRSRCQPIKLGQANTDQALQWLGTHTSASPEDLHEAIDLAPGAPMLALYLLEQGIPTWRKVLGERLEALEAGEVSAFDVARHCEKVSGQPAARYAIHFMQAQIAQEARRWLALTADETATDLQMSTKNVASILRTLNGFHRTLQETNRSLLSGANPNALMSLESLLMAWASCRQRISQTGSQLSS